LQRALVMPSVVLQELPSVKYTPFGIQFCSAMQLCFEMCIPQDQGTLAVAP